MSSDFQVQSILGDSKSQKLLEMLKQERALDHPSNQDMAVFRQNAERIIGGDDHVIRIDWVLSFAAHYRWA